MSGLTRLPRKGDVIQWPDDKRQARWTITRRDSKFPGIFHMVSEAGVESLFIADHGADGLNKQATIIVETTEQHE